MRKTIDILSEVYDYLIFDSPPELIVTDATVLSAQTDAVLLVVNARSTTKNQLKQSVEELNGLNKQAGLIGVVLNDLSAKRDGYYYNYYYYKRSYYREGHVGYGMEGDSLAMASSRSDFSRNFSTANQNHAKLTKQFLQKV